MHFCAGKKLFHASGWHKTPNILQRSFTTNLLAANDVTADSSSLNIDLQARPAWLKDPYFVGMIETDEKIFIFFREEAVEQSSESETVIVRTL